ncbi:hypothetical protein OIU77_004718, partial [Salix suchowensis]
MLKGKQATVSNHTTKFYGVLYKFMTTHISHMEIQETSSNKRLRFALVGQSVALRASLYTKGRQIPNQSGVREITNLRKAIYPKFLR